MYSSFTNTGEKKDQRSSTLGVRDISRPDVLNVTVQRYNIYPNYPEVLSKQFIPGGGGGVQLSSPLNPLKIQHFNGFCKFRGLDMYIKG